jgi:hypothetical protein
MPKDTETAGKELSFYPVAFNILRLEKFDDGLRHRESNRIHARLQTEKFSSCKKFHHQGHEERKGLRKCSFVFLRG